MPEIACVIVDHIDHPRSNAEKCSQRKNWGRWQIYWDIEMYWDPTIKRSNRVGWQWWDRIWKSVQAYAKLRTEAFRIRQQRADNKDWLSNCTKYFKCKLCKTWEMSKKFGHPDFRVTDKVRWRLFLGRIKRWPGMKSRVSATFLKKFFPESLFTGADIKYLSAFTWPSLWFVSSDRSSYK